MITLRPLAANDVAAIQGWPSYPAEFEELDYALRSNGWLAEHMNQPGSRIYLAEQDGESIAFTILSRTGAAEAEFRIALRADRIGQGLGEVISSMTLAKGFAEMQLASIHLIVRKDNLRAIRLYLRLGFTEHGECLKTVNGKQASFLSMGIAMTDRVTPQ
jgi:diamine N-acetyltransferase